VEIRREGEAVWFDPEGRAIPLTPETAWSCWLTLLAHQGFPAEVGRWNLRLRLDRAEASEPMPRRFPEDLPPTRSDAKASRQVRSRLPFRMLVGLFACAVLATLAVTLHDTALGLLGGGPITLILGLITLWAWRGEGPVIVSTIWKKEAQQWEMKQANGRVRMWNPRSAPGTNFRKRLSGFSPKEPGELKTLDLLLDDLAHAEWLNNRAKRRKTEFHSSNLEEEPKARSLKPGPPQAD
jgi:hypothetical protein